MNTTTSTNNALLEDIIQVEQINTDQTFMEVLKDPFSGGFAKAYKDFNISHMFETRKGLKTNGAIMASFAAWSVPHELIHAYTNVATGGSNEKMAFNKLLGGDFWAALVPGAQSEWMAPFIGGYVKIAEYGSKLGEYATAAAPYLLTPIGILLLEEGKRRKNLPLAVGGVGLVAAHLGGVIGDWAHIGARAVNDSVVYIGEMTGLSDVSAITDNTALQVAGIFASVYVGLKTLGFTYRAMKAGVNKARQKLFGEEILGKKVEEAYKEYMSAHDEILSQNKTINRVDEDQLTQYHRGLVEMENLAHFAGVKDTRLLDFSMKRVERAYSFGTNYDAASTELVISVMEAAVFTKRLAETDTTIGDRARNILCTHLPYDQSKIDGLLK